MFTLANCPAQLKPCRLTRSCQCSQLRGSDASQGEYTCRSHPTSRQLRAKYEIAGRTICEPQFDIPPLRGGPWRVLESDNQEFQEMMDGFETAIECNKVVHFRTSTTEVQSPSVQHQFDTNPQSCYIFCAKQPLPQGAGASRGRNVLALQHRFIHVQTSDEEGGPSSADGSSSKTCAVNCNKILLLTQPVGGELRSASLDTSSRRICDAPTDLEMQCYPSSLCSFHLRISMNKHCQTSTTGCLTKCAVAPAAS